MRHSCSKHDYSEERMLKYETARVSKFMKYLTPKKNNEGALIPEVDEILYTNLRGDELKQVAEDLNFFFPNSEIKKQVTLFNSELSPIIKKTQGQRAN